MGEDKYFTRLEQFRNAMDDFINVCIEEGLDPEQEIQNEVDTMLEKSYE